MHSDVFLACAIYAVGAASPGPSNMAIMAAAMSAGRSNAIWLAAGVLCGSMLWGAAASLGFVSILTALPSTFAFLKAAGGAYLFWLALKAARAASVPAPMTHTRLEGGTACAAFARGAAMHLTNPKAVLTWLSIVALAAPASGGAARAAQFLLACTLVGVVVFGGYALMFSTAPARRAYWRLHRWLNGGLCAVYSYAGIRLLRA